VGEEGASEPQSADILFFKSHPRLLTFAAKIIEKNVSFSILLFLSMVLSLEDGSLTKAGLFHLVLEGGEEVK